MGQFNAQNADQKSAMELVNAVMGTPGVRLPQSNGSTPGYFGLVVDPQEESTLRSRPSGNWSPPGSSIQSVAVRSPMLVDTASMPATEEFQRQQAALANSFHRPNISNNTSYASHQSNSTQEANGGSISPLSSPTKDDDGTDIAMPLQNLLRGQLGGGMRNNSIYSLPPEQPGVVPSFNLSFGGAVAGFARSKSLRTAGQTNGADGDIKGIEPARLVEILKNNESDVLILDVRTPIFYNMSRIKTAINICIPTTLLKRPSFNVSRLSETIQAPESKERFEKWKTAKYIVVYDGDAFSVSHAVSKFQREGWAGEAFYLTRKSFCGPFFMPR